MNDKEAILIHQNENVSISRYSNEAGDSIVIKKSKGNNISVISQLRNEYEITKKYKIVGVIQPINFISNEDETYIVFQDFSGEILSEYLNKSRLNLDSILKIGINLAKILGELHIKRVIHKDINPWNILINETSLHVEIIDFGISSEVSRNVQSLVPPKELEGSLPYISPEQSGRMNRIVDYRSDLYSLGVTIYQMLTGRVPFYSQDPMEIIHGHIAVTPRLPSEIDPSIPLILSQIVMKLLEKNAENRYQSAFGVVDDFSKCLANIDQLKSYNFKLGEQDNSGKIEIPQILYGRDNELELLLSSFEDVATNNKRKLLLVTGYSGVGKSSLVQEIYKPITEKNGIYLSGKFDQFQKNIPYYALTQLFNQFCNYLLLEDQSVLNIWRNRIQKGVGNNARVLFEIIPDLELLLPDQPSIQELGAQESQNRFNLTFHNFFQSICSKEHPLVIFIDDLQWADTASLNLLKSLISSEVNQYFLPIGSYRNNEVDINHPLVATLDAIRRSNVEIVELLLENLRKSDIENILVDSLRTNVNSVTELCSLLFNRTKGNAFFITQFLLSMYEEGHLRFDHINQEWNYDLESIKKMRVSENIIELMTFKIQKLGRSSQRALQLSSVIGNQFDLEFLSIIHEKDVKETLEDLWEAIDEGLVFPLNEKYKQIRNGMIEGINYSECEFKFLHDRVQQAAYSLIPESDMKSTHLKVGRLLLNKISEEKLNDSILEIVTQFNLARDLIELETEKLRLIELNIQASKKVKASNAYDVAKGFIDISLSLLSSDTWKKQYDLTLTVFHAAVEIAYILGNTDLMTINHEAIKKNVLDFKDSIPSDLNLILYYANVSEHARAIDLGLSILKRAGVSFSKNPSPFVIILNLIKIQIAIHNFLKKKKWEIKDMVNLPVMTDKESILMTKVILSITPSVFIHSPNLFPLLIFLGMKLILKSGYVIDSSTCIACFGLIQTAVLKKSNVGYEYAMLSNSIVERLKIKYSLHIVATEFGVRHRKEHLKNTLPYLNNMLSISMEQGYILEAGYAVNFIFLTMLGMSTHIPTCMVQVAEFSKLAKKLNAPAVLKTFNTYNSLYEPLLENIDIESIVNRFEWDKEFIESLNSYATVEAGQLVAIALDLFGHISNYELVIFTYSIFEKYKDAMVGYSINNSVWFFTTLAMIDAIEFNKPVKEFTTKEMKKIIKSNCKELERWALDAPMNYLHRWRLVEARIMILKKGSRDAIESKFGEAIALAKEYEFTNDEALANEMACEYLLVNDKKQYARYHLEEAITLYTKWGAKAKVKNLEEKYHDILKNDKKLKNKSPMNPSEDTISDLTNSGNTSGITSSNLDFISVLKASNAIAEEIHLDKLLSRITAIIVENAGAEKGYIIMKEGESFFIQSSFLNSEICILQNEGLESSKKLPQSIVNLSIRTKKLVVIDEAWADNRFQKDTYIFNNKPISILVMPIIHKAELIGLVYMENNRSKGVFTSERAETLQMIASQAAISIENAKLYLNVQEVTAERSRIQTEMELAQKIQTSLLPDKAELKGYEALGYMKTADEVGGDYYDTIIGESERQFAVIGDVSGHGVTSGLIMMMAQTALHTIIRNEKDSTTADILAKVNRTLTGNIKKLDEEKYMTMKLLELEPTGSVKYSGAHLDSVVYRINSDKSEKLESSGFWLGIEDDIAPFLLEREIKLHSGDVLLLYTDGLTEAIGFDNELFGFDKLTRVIQENGTKSLEHIKDAILESLKNYKTPDDVTMLILKKTKG